MKIRSGVIAAVMALAGLVGMAAPVAAAPKNPSQVAAAGPWKAVYLHALTGNGCASYNVDQYLEPITSEPCSSSSWWYFRDVSRSSGAIQAFDELEFVDRNMQFALGYSGGHVKLETPNVNTTFVVPHVISYVNNHGPYQELLVAPDYQAIAETAAGGDLLLLSSTGNFPHDAWIECPLTDATCDGDSVT